MMRKIEVIIADDHDLIIDGLTITLNNLAEVALLGDASNGEQLVRLTRQLQPDVILTDVKMPKMNGVEATKIIKEEFPHIGVIALSSYDDEHLIVEMIRAGAKGYLLKTAHKTEILKAIQAVFRDETYYCRHTNMKIAEVIAQKNLNPLKEQKRVFTPRESQVIQLICEGKTSREIGELLHLKTRTVERYRDAIMEKMDVHNTAGVVKYAIDHQLNQINVAKG